MSIKFEDADDILPDHLICFHIPSKKLLTWTHQVILHGPESKDLTETFNFDLNKIFK